MPELKGIQTIRETVKVTVSDQELLDALLRTLGDRLKIDIGFDYIEQTGSKDITNEDGEPETIPLYSRMVEYDDRGSGYSERVGEATELHIHFHELRRDLQTILIHKRNPWDKERPYLD